MTSGLKPFQQRTVELALERLRDRRGSRRFLVADEVGLGKTLVAQGIIQGMAKHDDDLRVFYICSSLSIARQNRKKLLDFMSKEDRKEASVEVDRLTMLPAARARAKTPISLYSFSTGAMPTRSGSGRVDERAVIAELLRKLLSLRRNAWLINQLRCGVKEENWRSSLARAESKLNSGARAIATAFRQELSQQLGLGPQPWTSTLEQALANTFWEAKGVPGAVNQIIQRLRLSLSLASLRSLSPDLLIFDEFQRFFDQLSEEPDEDSDEMGTSLLRHFLGTSEDQGPALLMLSATPYRLYGDLESGGGEAHHTEFFELMRFLHGERKDGPQTRALEVDFAAYGRALREADVRSRKPHVLRDGLQLRLAKVMARTERADVEGSEALDPPKLLVKDIETQDIAAFRYLRDASRAEDRPMVEPIWSSVPFPLQAMDKQGYVLAREARPEQPPPPDIRRASIEVERVRTFSALPRSHPRLRALLEEVPASLLSLPWLPPTRSWWPLGGAFAKAERDAPEGGCTKTLIFSRYRAVPRVLAAYLSYEAERAAFGRDAQSKRGHRSVQTYDYLARRRDLTRREGELKSRRVQPHAAFSFSGDDVLTWLEFFPLPQLAALGDPLQWVGSGRLKRKEVLSRIKERLERAFGGKRSKGPQTALRHWIRKLEETGGRRGTWSAVRACVLTHAEGSGREVEGRVERSLAESFIGAPMPDLTTPTESELSALAEHALLSPGCVLWRAVERSYGKVKGEGEKAEKALVTRLQRVAAVSLGSLRGYLDTPEFHLLFGEGNHKEQTRRAIWDGNFEAVLDEYFAVQGDFRDEEKHATSEEGALASLGTALGIRAASLELNRLPDSDLQARRSRKEGKITVRCHAALPLGIRASDETRESGALRTEFVREAFNSPFRPFVVVTTSVGQEGLDFHRYCSHLVHWDLPSNPVDLEQREGRIRRFGSLAIRRVVAASSPPLRSGVSPWRALRDVLASGEASGGLAPWWSVAGAKTRTSVYMPSRSLVAENLVRLQESLALYRMALGQPDQERLVSALSRRLHSMKSEEEAHALRQWLREARLHLSPYFREHPESDQREDVEAA